MGKSYIIQLAESRSEVIHKLYVNMNKKKELLDSKSESDSGVGLYSMRSDSESDYLFVGVDSNFLLRIGAD